MNATATKTFHSLAPIGFAGLEHSEVLATPRGRKFVWLRAVGEEAVEVELPSAFEDKVRLFDRFANVMPISVQS